MENGFHILPASRAAWNFLACLHVFAWGAGAPADAAPAPRPPQAAPPLLEHRELDAMLEAAFAAPAGEGQTRTFIVHFTLPGAKAARAVNWSLQLFRPDGRRLRQWRGRHVLHDGMGQVKVGWRAAPQLPPGVYRLRLRAGGIHQQRPIAVGRPPLLLPATAPLPVAVAEVADAVAGPARLDGLPYDIVYGNLHSQSNHSDGGGDMAQCRGTQPPRSGAFGPEDAFRFAQRHGLDFLLVSEHNHMYDGSERSDPAADPLAARQLYRIGRASAEEFSARHPGFVAMYGMEWGVISGGGHLNILDSPALLGWERAANGEPFADVLTPKNDYAALYALMREQGWTGQFNHPGRRQFPVRGRALAYTDDGGVAMALCEVMNSHAFSPRSDEGEARHSFFEEACGQLLEAGYRLAFSSNQDNHCANWGAAYGNRSGILLPAGTAPSAAALLGAIRARRVFATMDKHSAVALSVNGALMGATIENRGALTLQVHYASSAGRGIAALDIMEGVPGRHGEVKAMAAGGGALLRRFTPAPGAHFYYARITQDDGRQLWTAPVWVNQR